MVLISIRTLLSSHDSFTMPEPVCPLPFLFHPSISPASSALTCIQTCPWGISQNAFLDRISYLIHDYIFVRMDCEDQRLSPGNSLPIASACFLRFSANSRSAGSRFIAPPFDSFSRSACRRLCFTMLYDECRMAGTRYSCTVSFKGIDVV